MAFGFGFNKQKVLSAAEKCVQQGKLQNAIAEYEKILKADPKDLTVMNTVGDLHARLGEHDKAADCFKSVGDAYASQGFTVKAIAMYKKLSKLKTSMESVLRLAELYTQQGLFNDARAQYLLVAEDFLKSNQLDQAVKIFEKTLEMDPDNVPMRKKLAEVYVRMGKKPEAWKILTAAAESLRAKGQLAEADEILQRMLKLEPGNSYALVLRGRAALDAGDTGAAIAALTKVADLDTNVEGLKTLFQAYLRSKNFTEAGTLAAKLANVHDDNSAISEYVDALLQAQQYRETLQFYQEHADRLLRVDAGKLVESLHSIVGYVKEDTEALEAVLVLYNKAGDTSHLTEIYELMAHAYVQSGDLEKSREYYLKLMQLEPANTMHAKNYQQVVEKQGVSNTSHLITAEEGGVLIDELEATAPFIEQQYDDDTTLALRAALTDAELFISYNMPGKALEPLMSVLPKAPRDLRLNQKLAALHTRGGKFAEAAACCRTLESIYHDAGHAEEASRYGDLAAKYEHRGNSSDAKPARGIAAPPGKHTAGAPEFEISAPAVDTSHHDESAGHVTPAAHSSPAPSGVFFHSPAIEPEAKVKQSPASPQVEVAPVPSTDSPADVTSEWEDDLEVESPAATASLPVEQVHAASEALPSVPLDVAPISEPKTEEVSSPAPDINESIEEVRFYLGQGMVEQAEQILAKLEATMPGSPEIEMLRVSVDSAKQGIAQQKPEPEISIEESYEAEVEAPAVETAPAQVLPTPQPWPQTRPAAVAQDVPKIPEPQRPVLDELVSEIEASLGDDFLAPEKAPVVAPAEPEPVQAGASEFRPGSLDEFVSDLEASLGSELPAIHESATPVVPAQAPVAQAAAAATGALGTKTQPVRPEPQRFQVPPAQPVSPQKESVAGVDLANIFGELKQELEEETVAADEDPETHYNLGVAFREMGLLDEAIGEFQKVTQAADHGHPFSQLMQTYTWLAQCFLDKGIPEAAIRWYETALKLPSIDSETRTALHYELASSLESAGNKSAALKNFLEVYGSNIDYRDVGERIKALRP